MTDTLSELFWSKVPEASRQPVCMDRAAPGCSGHADLKVAPKAQAQTSDVFISEQEFELLQT